MLKNPYETLDEEKVYRVSAYVSIEDAMFLKGLDLLRGNIQTTINILINHVCRELRQRGITDYLQREQFEQYIEDNFVREVSNGGPVDRSGTNTNIGDVERGTPSACKEVDSSKNQLPRHDKDVSTKSTRRSRTNATSKAKGKS